MLTTTTTTTTTITGSSYAVAIYPHASYFNHSCSPNLAKWFQGSTLNLFALRDIEPGEELNITYVELDSSTDFRRKKLRDHYFFDCACARCRAYDEEHRDDKAFLDKYHCNSENVCCGLMLPECCGRLPRRRASELSDSWMEKAARLKLSFELGEWEKYKRGEMDRVLRVCNTCFRLQFW